MNAERPNAVEQTGARHSQAPSLVPGDSRMLFRPFSDTPERQEIPARYRRLRHSFFAWTGFRPIFAQHTREEHDALQRWVRGHKTVVEIGVAEGASALALRETMASDGTLSLVHPYHLSRVPWFNVSQRAAHACVNMSDNGRVIWIQEFSATAAVAGTTRLTFCFSTETTRRQPFDLTGRHGRDFCARARWRRFMMRAFSRGMAIRIRWSRQTRERRVSRAAVFPMGDRG